MSPGSILARATSPVAAGYIGHPANHRYSVADGYGWQTGSVFGLSRNCGR